MIEWPKLTWQNIDPVVEARLDSVLHVWKGTPYHENVQTPQAGVDCVRFVCAVADTMSHRDPLPIPRVPADQSFHCRESSMAALRLLMRRYGARRVEDGTLEPGDALITGPLNGGPGHVILAGTKPTEMWQSNPPMVWPTRYGPQPGYEQFFGVLRVPKEDW